MQFDMLIPKIAVTGMWLEPLTRNSQIHVHVRKLFNFHAKFSSHSLRYATESAKRVNSHVIGPADFKYYA